MKMTLTRPQVISSRIALLEIMRSSPRRAFSAPLLLVLVIGLVVIPLATTKADAGSFTRHDGGAAVAETGGKYVSSLQRFSRPLSSGIVEPQSLTPGVCNTGGPIEVESTGGTRAGIPTNYGTLALGFAAINGGTLHLGTIIIDVCGDTTEPGTGASLNEVTGVTSISISPVGGPRTLFGAISPGNAFIQLNGADNVTIDGLNTGGNSLLLSNTSTSSVAGTSTIRFIADASNNTITRTTILGSSTSLLGTAAGTILFSNGSSTGNDNNTISYCDIGPIDLIRPSKAIMASGSSSSIENDNVQILNNNIFDWFLTSNSDSGVNVLTGNDVWLINNNRFYQTASRNVNLSNSRHSSITWNNATGRFTASGNTIGFASSAGTGTMTYSGNPNEVRGIDVQASDPVNFSSIQGNTISGILQTTGRASTSTDLAGFIAIQTGTSTVDGPANIGNVVGNTIGSLDGSSSIVINATSTTAGTSPVQGILDLNFQTGISISNNNIGSITINNGGSGTTVGFRGILIVSTSGVSRTISNNTIGGAAAGSITDNIVGNYAMYGIQISAATATVTGNQIRNMGGASNGSALIISAGILASGATGGNTISQNTIHSLSNASGAVANSIYGMSLSLPAATNLVERNFIHSLSISSTLTGTQIWGINGGATGTTTYKNNLIRLGLNSAGGSVTLPTSMIGIRDAAGSTNQFFHNSIYIGGTGVLATPTPANSYGFFSDVVTVTRAFQDNIFWNARSNAVGGGVAHLAIRVGGTAANPAGLTSNYNVLYFSGTDGATGVFNATVVPTLAAWRTATGQDNNSIAADPLFTSPNGTSATVNLHIAGPSSPVAGAGLFIAGVTADYDGDLRPASNPDLGADEVVQASGGVVPSGTFYNAGFADGNTLAGNVTITNSLTLSGIVNAGAFTLTIDCGATVIGAGTNNYIVGNVQKNFCGAGTFQFPVGTPANGAARTGSTEGSPPEFTPMTATINSGTFPSSLTVKVTDDFMPGTSTFNSLSRHWDVTETGNLNVDMLFNYLDEDVQGTEANFLVVKFESGIVSTPLGSVNPGANTFTATGVTQFSKWGAGLVPTVAGAGLGGRILDANGRPIGNARVVLTGAGLTEPLIAQTGQLGYFNFGGLAVGRLYIITVSSDRHEFSNPTRVYELNSDVTNADFVAEP